MSSAPSNQSSGLEKSRKRPRAARACQACRAKKYKCDENYPCGQCKMETKTSTKDCGQTGSFSELFFQHHSGLHLSGVSYVAGLEKRVQELSELPQPSPRALPNTVHPGIGPGPVVQHIGPAHHQAAPFDDDSVSPRGTRDNVANGASSMISGLPSNSQQLQGNYDESGPPSDNESSHEAGGELRDVNPHTNSTEYHGNTSSMAFLAHVQKQSQQPKHFSSHQPSGVENPSLVSTLHNVAFSPNSNIPSAPQEGAEDESFYFRQSRIFLDGYFENLHFIHPIIKKEDFLARCEDLWFGRSQKQPRSFVALYYSLMSLGALVRVWDEPIVEGMNRFQWSRKLFTNAKLALGELRSTNDLETVQCMIFMAKVCQNELNPHLAYMYLGTAVRASLSAGHNREPVSNKPGTPSEDAAAISKTWWGLYSLETEMSFSLGRPDTLGMDEYHSRQAPPVDESETAILSCMIPFARITRKVSVHIYLSKSSIRDKIAVANQIEEEMNAWVGTLPEKIRPQLGKDRKSFRILKDPKWARRQRLVLQLRYLNVQMIVFRPFLVYASRHRKRLPSLLTETVAKCVDAAKATIEVMHETYRNHVFFRTWWYNVTYTLYAAAIVLSYISTVAPAAKKPELFELVEMTIEVLDAMDESVTAQKSSEMIKQALTHAREHAANSTSSDKMAVNAALSTSPSIPSQPQHHHQSSFASNEFEDRLMQQRPGSTGDLSISAMLDNQMPSMHLDAIFDFDEAGLSIDENQFLFWTELNGTLGGFGP